MRLVLAVLVASTGCAQLFGIDETTSADANSNFATVQVQKISIGASVLKTPLDVSNQMATFYDDTAGTLAPLPGVQVGLDTFIADAPGNPSTIYTVPDVQVPTRMAALPARAQRANYVEFEHSSPQDALPSSALMLSITLPSVYTILAPAAETFTMQAIGAWMTHNLVAAELPLPDMAMSTISTTLQWSAFTAMVAGNPKVRMTSADVLLLVRYTDCIAPCANKLSGVFQAQFDQTDGVDPVSGTMTAVQANSMLMATIDPNGYTTRFAAVRPAVAGLSQSWRVDAAPGWSLGAATGVRLVSGTAAVTDTAVTSSFGNPFESLDWNGVFTFSTSSSRSYAYSEGGMMASVPLTASMTTLSEPSTSLAITMPAGLPITVEANEQILVTDGMTLPLDLTKPVVIEATLDRPTNTAYQLTLVELGLDTTGMTPLVTKRIVLEAMTAGAPRFKLPPELFTVGKSYYVNFRAFQGGVVNAADGDLQTIMLPYSLASLDSAVFTVGMP